ncbi:MAG: hypothetical protein ACSHW9_04365 [Salinibacterium amurskyense]
MGSNKRYARQVDARMDTSIVERIMASSAPDSLSDEELELSRFDLTQTRNPRPVWAWVRYSDGALQVEADAVAWTERAVAIKWQTISGQPHRAWVWGSAVESR